MITIKTDAVIDADPVVLRDMSLLLVEDDRTFRERLARALRARGFEVTTAEGIATGKSLGALMQPCFAVIDLKLDDGNGLDVVELLHQCCPQCRILVLTGFGNIATAVAAVKYGAFDFISKPADADDITAALLAKPGEKPAPPDNPMSATRIRWEHIQRVHELTHHNISDTARRLKMHRRTLQRILRKFAPH
jgi:two-component system response regulator RegA